MTERLGPYELNTIVTGDARELAKAIPDESVDLIFTDPPYLREYIELYSWLGSMAARVLKPGGSVFAYVGHAHLPRAIDLMRLHLNYHWLCCQYQPTVTNTARYWPALVYIRWKPVLWFVKGEYTNRFFVQDGISSSATNKKWHEWQQPEQSAVYWLEQMLQRLDAPIVLEPFAGGGTTLAACEYLGAPWLGFEIDPDTAQDARERVANTQPPLPIPVATQETLI